MNMKILFPGGKKSMPFTRDSRSIRINLKPKAETAAHLSLTTCFWHPSVPVPGFMSYISAMNGVSTRRPLK